MEFTNVVIPKLEISGDALAKELAESDSVKQAYFLYAFFLYLAIICDDDAAVDRQLIAIARDMSDGARKRLLHFALLAKEPGQ